MAKRDSLVEVLRKDHKELRGSVVSLKKSAGSSDRSKMVKALKEIEKAAAGHFKFEENYLYPRMQRLIFEIVENLRDEQNEIKENLTEKTDIYDTLDLLMRHLDRCDDLVAIADKFREEEKDDLNKKLKECCNTI